MWQHHFNCSLCQPSLFVWQLPHSLTPTTCPEGAPCTISKTVPSNQDSFMSRQVVLIHNMIVTPEPLHRHWELCLFDRALSLWQTLFEDHEVLFEMWNGQGPEEQDKKSVLFGRQASQPHKTLYTVFMPDNVRILLISHTRKVGEIILKKWRTIKAFQTKGLYFIAWWQSG